MPDYQNIKELVKKKGIPAKRIYEAMDVTKQYYYSEASKQSPSENFVKKLIDVAPELKPYLLDSNGLLLIDFFKQQKGELNYDNSKNGTPYYDVDFTASFLEVINNQQTNPDSFISHPFFNGCDFIVRASGQSMAKIIKHGDLIGLRKIEGWQDFLPLGEVYAIVTHNGFRMVKIITAGETEDSYTLLSKPNESKKEEFPPQQINKEHILHIYKVHASSHLF